MTAPITVAHLSGPLRQALAVVDGETWLFEDNDRRRPTNNDIRFFFEYGAEIREVAPPRDSGLSEIDLLSLLNLEACRFQVLQGLLVGMDSELDDDLRRKNIRRANRFLTDPSVADFIERRFLKPVSQQAWDLPGALRLARTEKLSAVERLYAIVSGPLLLQLEDEIALWASNLGYASVERAVAVDKAYETGLLAAIVCALHDGKQDQVRAKVFLTKDIQWDRKLAAHLVNRFAPIGDSSRLPGAEAEDDDLTAEPSGTDIVAQVRLRVSQLLDEFRSRQRRQGHRDRGESAGAEILPAILNQIEWIVTRFETGHLQAGWDDVVQLAKRQLADGDPDKLAMSLTSLATQLVRQKDIAFELCDLAGMCAPDDPAVWTARAELWREWGQLGEALAAYDRAVEDFPQNAVARNGRAETLRVLGRFEEALAAYDRTVEDFPQNVVARSGRAETLRALGRFEEALTAYDRTVEDFPQDVVARSGRAETLRALGRFEEALAAYDRTVEDFPQDAVARSGRAETLRVLGRFEEALAAYDRAVEDFPQDAVARNGRAETLRALGRFEEALTAYDRTVEDFPQDVVARSGRAETLRALGRFEEALAAYD